MNGLLYLDSCCIIYLHEGVAPFQEAVRDRLIAHGADPAASLVTSRLARLECRVGPLKADDRALIARYDAFFSRRRLQVSEIDAGVIENATELRARYGIKTPDAIHLATAIH